ncbi:MAG: hypothetical protein H8M99_01440 [Gloeobacteraceae cyanobacterium ES-bin-144]|nr:hypothetical protein [Verrucomicrobiales bacterium]
MKTNIITIAALIASLTFATAAEKIKAPNNGRIIETTKPNAEFLVTADKKIEIRFLDASGKVISPADQVVTVTMGDRSNPTKLAFTKDGDKLVSDKTIPNGKELPVVLQIKTTPDAKAATSKFNLNFATCPTCKHPEYACSCDHHHEGGGAGHAH